MLPSGHFAAGYLVTTALIKVADANLSTNQVNIITIVGTLAAVAPDIDLVYFFIKKKKGKLKENESHRLYITHTPLLWLLISLAIYSLGGTVFWEMIGLSVWIGSWSHFILDSIEFGVPWLWPLSKKVIAIKKMKDPGSTESGIIKSQWEFITKIYPKMITSFIEILIIGFAILTYVTTLLNSSK